MIDLFIRNLIVCFIYVICFYFYKKRKGIKPTKKEYSIHIIFGFLLFDIGNVIYALIFASLN